ncbi:DUF2637 domain-containing protein [Streptomyces sp. NBC_01497]|uniref:DUF2637 domain-containing protein n=1 Tax=Streptomyces sp. NBC_01497 TaxID=2903885 RepID=UPI002E32E183|nr:DUF2637 domain-containing protein [Streptomyces sp. NBC_01497]
MLTVTPLVQRVTPDGWDWTGPILPIVVDAAVVIVVRLDSVVSRLGASGGKWPALLRWMTGLMTLLLNIGNSALAGDAVGVAVHAVAPCLLIVTAEAGLAYRRAIARGLDSIAKDEAAERERERLAREARERAAREEREAREQAERAEREQERERRERLEREAREHAERLAREQADRERDTAREQREHEAGLERERAKREANEKAAEQARIDAREERERRERREREEREHQQHIAARAAQQAQIQQRQTRRALPAAPAVNTSVNGAVNTRAGSVNARPVPVNTPAPAGLVKVSEDVARAVIADPVNAGLSVRQLAEETGWSIGWVSARRAEQRQDIEENDTDEAA